MGKIHFVGSFEELIMRHSRSPPSAWVWRSWFQVGIRKRVRQRGSETERE